MYGMEGTYALTLFSLTCFIYLKKMFSFSYFIEKTKTIKFYFCLHIRTKIIQFKYKMYLNIPPWIRSEYWYCLEGFWVSFIFAVFCFTFLIYFFQTRLKSIVIMTNPR